MKLSHWEPDVRTLISWIRSGEIDLQPNFQRGDVWPLPKKRKLIDTILRGWSIPPVHVVVTNSGTLDVLDGQQRLTAIRDFMDDGFTIDGSIEPSDPEIEELHGLRYSLLPLQTRRAFDQYTLRVFRITDYRPEEPGELFYRLNQQIVLTAGEQRNAIFGPAREQLKLLVNLFEKAGNEKDTIGFSNSRLAYDDVFAKLLFFIEYKSFGHKATESRISDRFKLQKPFDEQLVTFAEKAIKRFTQSRSLSTKLKLNKASLLSWLLFFVRFDHFEPAPNFLPYFEAAKIFYRGEETTPRLPELLTGRDYTPRRFDEDFFRLFVDRSSLRVSDISSVVYRDFAIWAIYSRHGFGALPLSVSPHYFDMICDVLEERDDASLDFVLDSYLDLDKWAQL